MSTNCECTTTPKLVFSCSGAADVGELADRVARQLNREGTAKMYCLTGIGAGIQNITDYTKSASAILAIDGCPVDCTKKLLEKAGFKDFAFMRITDLGYTKGKTEITDEIISAVACQASNLVKENVHAK
jgi:uncharacterized metal-binding protein